MAVSLHDVAHAASLSCETLLEGLVSPSSLEPEVVRHVMKHIRQSKYLETFDRWKQSERSTPLAVLIPGFESGSTQETFRGIDRVMSALGLNASMVVLPTRSSVPFREGVLHNLLKTPMIDAVIAMNLKPDSQTLATYTSEGKPLILMHCAPPKAQSVMLENIKGSSTAVNYLVRKGYRRIALVNGPSDGPVPGLVSAERMMGYISALQRAALHHDDALVFETPDFDPESGRLAFEAFRSRSIQPDAVFCTAGDLVAIGYIKAAQNAGLRVPEDIAVIGYDDLPIASLVTPPLTTIRQRLMIAGAAAAVLALEAYVNGPGQNLVIMPELVIRGTA